MSPSTLLLVLALFAYLFGAMVQESPQNKNSQHDQRCLPQGQVNAAFQTSRSRERDVIDRHPDQQSEYRIDRERYVKLFALVHLFHAL